MESYIMNKEVMYAKFSNAWAMENLMTTLIGHDLLNITEYRLQQLKYYSYNFFNYCISKMKNSEKSKKHRTNLC